MLMLHSLLIFLKVSDWSSRLERWLYERLVLPVSLTSIISLNHFSNHSISALCPKFYTVCVFKSDSSILTREDGTVRDFSVKQHRLHNLLNFTVALFYRSCSRPPSIQLADLLLQMGWAPASQWIRNRASLFM